MHNLFSTLLALTFCVSLVPHAGRAQSVGIGTTAPDGSAVLEVRSTSQGLLPPRLTSAQRQAIASPAPGLLVFQTDGTLGLYRYSGVAWLNLTTGRVPDATGSTVPANGALVSTLAGTSGASGNANGTGAAASFNSPYSVAVDAGGTLYVADRNNNLIRKISPAGVVTTLAGSGSRGNVDGTGTAASFSLPYGVAVDAAGTVYVADVNNSSIRKISPAGVVTTLAGSGTQGNSNGTGPAASFNSPGGVAVDAAGTVYVADTGNNLIRKISPAGLVSTLAGTGGAGSANGTGTAASFYRPSGVAVDATGNVYVADYANQLIRKISPAGLVNTLAGMVGKQGNSNGTGPAASFSYPTGVAVDAGGTLYVADQSNNLIRKISPAGLVSTLAGTGGAGSANGTGTAASFTSPTGVAVDASGAVYVADQSNQLVRVVQ